MAAIPVVMLAGDKATTPIAGRQMARWVEDAFYESGYPVTMMARDGAIVGSGIKVLIPEDATLTEKLWEVLELHREDHRVVITTCDIPCVTGEEIGSFLQVADSLNTADVVVPVVNTRLHAEFAGFPATKIWVEGMQLTMGNVFVVNPASLLQNREVIEALIRDRKKILQLASMAGPGFVLKLLVAQMMRGRGLSLSGLETTLSKMVGEICVRAVVAGPGIGFDGDDKERLELLSRILRARAAVL